MKTKLLLTALLSSAFCAGAIEFIQTEQFTVSADEIQTNELWVSAQTLAIEGEMRDDLFAAGTALDMRGVFLGDVWGAADNLSVSGKFADNVRLMAYRTAQISGTLDGSLTAAGTTITIEPAATISGGLLCFGENIISQGTVGGDARIIAQKTTVGGTVGGSLTVVAQEISILPGTVIRGDLNYTAPKELVLSPTVQLEGELNRILKTAPARTILKPDLTSHFLFALAALVAGLFVLKLFPHYSAATLHILRTARGIGTLIGLAALVVIPMLSFFLLFTVIGLPLSLLLGGFYLILLYLSRIMVALWIGMMILRRKELPRRAMAGTLALGLLILYSLTAITVISLAVNLLVIITGLGAMLLALFKKPVLIIQTPDDLKKTTTEG